MRHNDFAKEVSLMNIKRLLCALLCAVLCLTSVLPTSAMGKNIIESSSYSDEDTLALGWDGVYVLVRPDGSFEYERNGEKHTALFGTSSPVAKSSFDKKADPYPVSVHSYSVDGIAYNLRQFVMAETDEAGNVTFAAVYSRLKVKNNTDVSQSFPRAFEGTLALTEISSEIAPKKTAKADYVTVIKGELGESTVRSYKNAESKMKAMWDEILHDILTVSGLFDDTARDYRSAVVKYNILKGEGSQDIILASDEYASITLETTTSCYAAAVALIKTKDTESAKKAFSRLSEKYEELYSSLESSDLSGDGKLLATTLEKNLLSLSDIWGYAYIAKILSAEDDSYESVSEEAFSAGRSLADGIANCIEEIDKKYDTDWEAVTTREGFIVNGEDFASANALCDWYIKSTPFSLCPSASLRALAIDAMDYRTKGSDEVASYTFVSSLISERDDGTLIIGRGTPDYYLSNNESFSVDNYTLSSGTTVSMDVVVEKNQVDISVYSSTAVAIQAEFSAFRDNIEYSSAGFDSDSGIVTAPEGTTSITVRLIDTADRLLEERTARTGLEASLAKAYRCTPEVCTKVSRGIFEKALTQAQNARSATAQEQKEAAKKLNSAIDTLSPTVAGYSVTIPDTTTVIDTVTCTEIYQKFSLPSDGTVTTLYLYGEYSDDISCAVYTLRGDAYTTDELRAESYGEEVGEGIAFDLDMEITGETVYVVCIFTEDTEMNVPLVRSTNGAQAHTQSGGETTVYSGASLGLHFTVEQVDRANLDTFYHACLNADVSEYTKESQKKLKKAMSEAKELLCTPSVTESEYDKVYDDLKKAYDGLDTYASEDKVDETPIVGLVLIGIVAVLLAGTFISALAARKKMDIE